MNQKMKRFVLLFICCFFTAQIVSSLGDSFLPSLDELLGVKTPLIESIFPDKIDTENTSKSGLRAVSFNNVTFDDYNKIGRCFFKSSFSLLSAELQDYTIVLKLQKDNNKHLVMIQYIYPKFRLIVTYPKYYTEDRDALDVKSDDPSLFPEVEELLGVILPRLSEVLKKEPDIIKRTDQSYIEQYNDFSEEDYGLASTYLQSSGSQVVDYKKEDKKLIIRLEKREKAFILTYDPENRLATMEYPLDCIVEPMSTNTPAPTPIPTPEPTSTPEPVPKLNSSLDDSILFTPTVTNALKINNWMSSGLNRALLAFSLGANAADDQVLGRVDVIQAFMYNPTFVGKDAGSENLIAASLTETDMIFIYYSPTLKQAYVFVTPYNGDMSQGSARLEYAMSNTCSECYKITKEEMESCIQYVKSVLN